VGMVQRLGELAIIETVDAKHKTSTDARRG
jgi:hypothetical protein